MNVGGLNTRRYSRATANHTEDAHTSGSQDCYGLEEAEACEDAEGHQFQDLQRPQVCSGDCEGGDGFNGGHACFVSSALIYS